ncbi:MAG TPA: cytochrome c oxidase subunit II [Alphaproteobacteria bacterium]|nr:cytochrome c oxidase subunit II [Alphaproteobacteria bacterium]
MTLKIRHAALGLLALCVAGLQAGSACAEEPRPWEIGLQPAASLTAERIDSFHTMLLWIITLITLFVLALLVYVIWRFRESRNPVPSKTAHHTFIEILWTVVPIMILVVIAIPSFKLLYYADKTADAQMTLKAIGHQWYWSYEYPDDKVTFDSILVEDADLKQGQPRLLTVDNPVVVPVNTNIRLLIASEDVMHAWTMPALGVNLNAVPGRLNETWMNIEREGTYYGQCFQLCGVNHGFMPIEIRAVSKDDYAKWLADKKKQAANSNAAADAQLAQTATIR